MKKIASLILAGAMLLSGFLMPMQVKGRINCSKCK